MDGQGLYERYEEVNVDVNNCEVEPWVELIDGEKDVWRALATRVNDDMRRDHE